MNELESILDAFHQSERHLHGSVLATVVHVKGSSYRRPGARMLVMPDGRRLGTISGGCLESDVARKARWWVFESTTALKTYDTSSEGAAWEFGLGCNGVITLLLEDAGSEDVTDQFAFLSSAFRNSRPVVIATVVRTQPGSSLQPGMRLLTDGCHAVGGRILGLHLAAELDDSIDALRIDESTAVVMMTHNYPLDLRLLPRILARSPRYLGMLGPRSRAERLFAEVGIDPGDYPVHAPVGLDIGGDHPETIALAIAAEIQSALSGRDGGFLKWRAGPIHAPPREIQPIRTDRWTSGHGIHAAMSSIALAQCELTLASRHE